MLNTSTDSIKVIIVLAGTLFFSVQSARILAIETVAGKSHWNFMSSVLRSLTENGHEVTVFTPFPDGNRDTYTEVDISSILPIKVNMNLLEFKKIFNSQFTLLSFLMQSGRHSCELLYNNEKLNDIMSNDLRSNFDAIFIEPRVTGCLTYIATKSDLPLIFIVPTAITFFTDRYIFGDVPNPASVSPLTVNHAVPSTFIHRFANTVWLLYSNAFLTFKECLIKIIDPKPYDFNTHVPPSLMFINSHFISDVSRPIPANAINVGGIHLKSVKKIPKDMLEFIENSSHGVILFTFGSTIELSLLPEDVQRVFIDILAVLPQRVLLKYGEEMKDRPKNIMTKKWLPQRDILMHPKVKLFISHGGISGLYEAVDAGVPVLGFPLFGDQHRNIDNLVNAGMAISTEIFSVSKDEFSKNVRELIDNEKYTENAKIASDIFRDRPMSPENSVVYWTEYVVRHKGAPHLKSHALNLPWYQYVLLDVIAAVFVFIFVVIFVIFKFFTLIRKYFLEDSRFKVKSD